MQHTTYQEFQPSTPTKPQPILKPVSASKTMYSPVKDLNSSPHARSYSCESIRSLDEHNAIVRRARPHLRKMFDPYARKAVDGSSGWSSSESEADNSVIHGQGQPRPPKWFVRGKKARERQCGAGVDEVLIRKVDATIANCELAELDGSCELARKDTIASWRSIRRVWKEKKDRSVVAWKAEGLKGNEIDGDDGRAASDRTAKTWWGLLNTDAAVGGRNLRRNSIPDTAFSPDAGLLRVSDQPLFSIARKPVASRCTKGQDLIDDDNSMSQLNNDASMFESRRFSTGAWRLLTSQLPPVVLRRPSQASRPHSLNRRLQTSTSPHSKYSDVSESNEEPLWCRLAMMIYALATETFQRIWNLDLGVLKIAFAPIPARSSPEAARVRRACAFMSVAGRLVLLLYGLLCLVHFVRCLFTLFMNPGRVAFMFVQWLIY